MENNTKQWTDCRVLKYLQMNPGSHYIKDVALSVNLKSERVLKAAESSKNITITETQGTCGFYKIEYHGYAPYCVHERFLKWAEESKLSKYLYSNQSSTYLSLKCFKDYQPSELAEKDVFEVLINSFKDYSIAKDKANTVKTSIHYAIEYAKLLVKSGGSWWII